MERRGCPAGGGVIWYAYCSCMRQASDEGVTAVLPSTWPSGAGDAVSLGEVRWRRRVLVRRLVRRGVGPLAFCARGLCRRGRAVRVGASGLPFARCALRAFFHALRVASACLRARLASRLASLTRLRARLSSSLAIRTRCRATSACRRARSSGAAGTAAEGVLGAEALGLPFAPDGPAPADRFFFAVFPMQKAGGGKGRPVSHNGPVLATVILSTDFVNNPVQRAAWPGQSRCASKGLRQRGQRLTSRSSTGQRRPCRGRVPLAEAQRDRAGSIVAVTRLRPEFLLR
jgi:hypothetical protein